MLDQLTESAAQVVSDIGVTLAQNYLAQALLGPKALGRNFYVTWFLEPAGRSLMPAEDHEHHSRTHVADLRATAARRQVDAQVGNLIRRLRAGSAEFARLWDEHEVAVKRSERKRFNHPVIGLIELDCEVLLTPEHDQRLLGAAGHPGARAAQAAARGRSAGPDQARTGPAAGTADRASEP